MESLAKRVTTAPPPFDPARGSEAVDALPGPLQSGRMGELLQGAAGSSPYLTRLLARHGAWLADQADRAPEASMATLLADTAAEAKDSDLATLSRSLRTAKGRAALLIALADLGGVWDLMAVTNALSDLADGLIGIALDRLMAEELRRGKLPGATAEACAFSVIAMGKLGARELNYSSDIDLICLFDQDRFQPETFAEVKARLIHVTRHLVKLLSEQTGDGYVFRTDLRLRPAPSTTPVCMAMEAAERYYEALGRTWERAAHIKARSAAGDIPAGQAYLERLTPFVWRRYLDFAAIEDTQDMLRKIRQKNGRSAPSAIQGTDVKLDPGGIRVIEFFAQTRQLIMGGRMPDLREPTTLGALRALAARDIVAPETAERLAEHYVAHRHLEHRLQMVEDAQTQTIPVSPEGRARVAHLCGFTDQKAWERDLADRLAEVHGLTEDFLGPVSAREANGAPLGAPDLQDTALADAGFERPENACRVIERWRSGSLPALRTERAQRLYRRLEPRILQELSRARQPDEAIAWLDRFLSGLPAGVQVFSLFSANPHLLELVVGTCAAAPRLADYLARAPGVLDALLTADFFQPIPALDDLAADLERVLLAEEDYERQLDAARRWAREHSFRAGLQVLRGVTDEGEAGIAFSDIAEACLRALYPRVIANFSQRHGPPPGEGMAVIAMGKLGTREMTAGSDLDLILVYDPGDAEASEGPKPLAPAMYYPRLTQALVAALTAPTAEGRLYEVDMRLRPSGRQGPVAVTLAAFVRYQSERAWVWEHLALTRARVVVGPAALSGAVSQAIADALSARQNDPGIKAAALEMRLKLAEAHRTEREKPWSLKHAPGGLMEIEFLAQTGVLELGLGMARSARASLSDLARAGWLPEAEAKVLGAALSLQTRLQQIERVALENGIDPNAMGEALGQAMAKATGHPDLAALDRALGAAQAEASRVITRRFEE